MTILRLAVMFMATFILSVPRTVATQPVPDTASTPVSRYAVTASFGVGMNYEEGKIPVVTYIPATYLLFELNEEEPDIMLSNREYSAVTTQDGVRLFMLHSKISQRTTTELGNLSVIFNGTERICEKTGCNINDDDKVLEIHHGEAFVKSSKNGEITLKGTRLGGEIISGVISRTKLAEWNLKGIVTLTEQAQPRLSVTRGEGNYFNLGCSKKRGAGNAIKTATKKINEFDITINNRYEIATVVHKRKEDLYEVTYNNPMGRDNVAYNYRVYKVKDRHLNIDRTFVAQIVYDCGIYGADEFMNRIIKVTLRTLEGERIVLDPHNTPKNLKEWTGTPHYLYSVNTSEQYFHLMAKLGNKFNNRAEAGYFLSEFNRSCFSDFRKKDECSNHHYRD